MFPIITYYYFSIDQILKIVQPEMETKKIVSLAIILTNLKKCHLHQTIFKYWVLDTKCDQTILELIVIHFPICWNWLKNIWSLKNNLLILKVLLNKMICWTYKMLKEYICFSSFFNFFCNFKIFKINNIVWNNKTSDNH